MRRTTETDTRWNRAAAPGQRTQRHHHSRPHFPRCTDRPPASRSVGNSQANGTEYVVLVSVSDRSVTPGWPLVPVIGGRMRRRTLLVVLAGLAVVGTVRVGVLWPRLIPMAPKRPDRILAVDRARGPSRAAAEPVASIAETRGQLQTPQTRNEPCRHRGHPWSARRFLYPSHSTRLRAQRQSRDVGRHGRRPSHDASWRHAVA
jgi:hypothetical protein